MADSSSDDAAWKSKLKKVSVPGMLGLAFFITGAAMTVTACLVLPWRIGAGSSSSLYAGLLGPDFKQREYFMYNVKGVSKRSWHDLTVLTCDKAAKVEIVNDGRQDSICDTPIASTMPEKCSKNFLPHVKDRCYVYNFVMHVNSSFCVLTFVYAGVAIILGGIGVAPILPGLKKFFLPLALAICFATLSQLGAWMYLTDEKFTFIGRSAEFPYPGITTGFYIHLVGDIAYGVAGLFFYPQWAGKEEAAGDSGDGEKGSEKDKDEAAEAEDI